MKKNSTSFLALITGLLLFCSHLQEANAQSTPVDAQTAAQLQAKLDELISVLNLKGLSASVIIPGKGTWNGVSGVSHGTVPIDTAMVFRYASITKTFTAAGILLLQEDGLLTLSDSLHEFLPTYPNIDSSITIRQLLQHTSGIFSYTLHPNHWPTISSNPTQAMTPQYVLNTFVNAPYFAPGTSYEYSNTNYLLLGLIIEQVSGQSYAQFIRQRLLDPLQLTSLYVAEHEPATGVMPHNWAAPNPSSPGTDFSYFQFTALHGTSPADGAMAGNAYDLARWGQALFTGQVLQDTSVQLMKQFLPLNMQGPWDGYGLGLILYNAGNSQSWGHGGNNPGFTSSVMFSPADSIVVGVLSNKDGTGDAFALALLATARQLLLTQTPDEAGTIPNTLVCFPNPAQAQGKIQYSLVQAQQVEITMHNALGQPVQTLLSQHKQAGTHYLTIDTSTLPSGVYYCTLQTNSGKIVQPWVVVR